MLKCAVRSPPSRPASPIKAPEPCPHCGNPHIATKSRRLKKLETARLYHCRAGTRAKLSKRLFLRVALCATTLCTCASSLAGGMAPYRPHRASVRRSRIHLRAGHRSLQHVSGILRARLSSVRGRESRVKGSIHENAAASPGRE